MCHQMLPSFNSSPTKWFNHGPKLCEAMFKCESNSEVDTIKTNIYDNITISRQPRSPNTRGLLFGRPVRKPKDSYKRRECRKCERKRAGCTRFYLFTYGVCGGAYIAGGSVLSTACNIITLPRTIDCTLNTLLNCFMRNCGLVGLR